MHVGVDTTTANMSAMQLRPEAPTQVHLVALGMSHTQFHEIASANCNILA